MGNLINIEPCSPNRPRAQRRFSKGSETCSREWLKNDQVESLGSLLGESDQVCLEYIDPIGIVNGLIDIGVHADAPRETAERKTD